MRITSLHKAIQQAGDIDIIPLDLVEFNSAGRLLIIGSAQQIQAVTPRLAPLDIMLVCVDEEDKSRLESKLIIRDKILHISGWMGQFTVQFESQQLSVDLVLDLSDQPFLTTKVLPLGYFAPRNNTQLLAETLQQLPALTGTYDKPQYFNYKATICAHSQRQLAGCSQCIDACPAEAIVSTGDTVTVNPALCQGCGSCTSVCPSGAMMYALPALDVSVNRLRKMIQAWFELEITAPHILIHDMMHGQALLDSLDEGLPTQVITFSIEEIGALGMPFWLSALAYGAGSVTVWDTASHPDHDWLEVQHEISKTNQILVGLGYQADVVNWLKDPDSGLLLEHLSTSNILSGIPAASFSGIDEKRRMITMALDHLHQHAPKPIAVLALSSDAAFGEIKVNKSSCTLCHACVTVCPVGAVSDGFDLPQLNFIEDLCVQCGLCKTACPENAIALKPQYVFNRVQARKLRLLHDEPVFHCIHCHDPFATQKMINNMTDKLKNHAMFQGQALERLKMCKDCRVKAMFNDTQKTVP